MEHKGVANTGHNFTFFLLPHLILPTTYEEDAITISFYRRENCSTERESNLQKVTQLLRSVSGLQVWNSDFITVLCTTILHRLFLCYILRAMFFNVMSKDKLSGTLEFCDFIFWDNLKTINTSMFGGLHYNWV